MIWGAPPRERPYTSREYDPFWAAAQELEMPLSLHVITGKKPPKSKRSARRSAWSRAIHRSYAAT